MRALIAAVFAGLLAQAAPGGLWAQQPSGDRSRCTTDLQRIGLALLEERGGLTYMPDEVPSGNQAELCSDGTSHTMVLSESVVAPTRLMGCPVDIAATGFGRATTRTRTAPGGFEVILVSVDRPGCSAIATFHQPRPLVRVERGDAPELDGQRIAARTRQEFARFWRDLPRAEAAALERRLGELGARAGRGGNVDRELAGIRIQYPHLVELSNSLQRESWYLVGAADAGAGTATCDGTGWLTMDGRPRCIGTLRVHR